MDRRQLQEELARWSFMPGWGFEAFGEDLYGNPQLRIFGEVLCAYVPGRVVTVHRVVIVPRSLVPGGFFDNWLQHLVREMMVHESDEWLMRDGVRLVDPHG